ncbi:MAG: SusC/RagA family TonB-linked outer membrane protein [Prevotella sp.]|nr:SusC/RagA family TonB-linked outer membrane protein [Prevotella sp.]MBR3109851.1 SusC/RagA family TonB-linked outer membrane protein [Prevotella sp.]
MKQRLTMFMISLFLFAGSALAQTKVSGTVLSQDDGQPIIGAAVKVDGTSTGMLTDVNGKFTITLPQGKDQLVVSYLGYEGKTVTAKNGMRIFLKSDAAALDEVIVVAYGTAKKASFTGSASLMKEKDMSAEKGSLVKSLEGKVAGVRVGSAIGDPGADQNILIRGIGSINGSTQPLYVIDGVPMLANSEGYMSSSIKSQSILASINPNDIESMTILKDAAAASLYGSRAANGVIIITTKKGKTGKTNVHYDMQIGWQQIAVKSAMDRMNASQLKEYYYQGIKNFFLEYGYADNEADAIELTEGEVRDGWFHDFDGTTDTNWYDQVYHSALTQDHQISIDGGNEKTKFYVGLGYNDSEGVVKGSKFQRYSGRANIDHQITDWLKVGVKQMISFSDTKGYRDQGDQEQGFATTTPWSVLYSLDPTAENLNPDGTYNNDVAFGKVGNPNNMFGQETGKYAEFVKSNIMRSMSNADVEVKLPYSFTARSVFGYDYTDNKLQEFWAPESVNGESLQGLGQRWNFNNKTLTSSTTLAWDKQFGLNTINALVGYEYEDRNILYMTASAKGYGTEKLPELSNGQAYDTGSSTYESILSSWLGKVDYNYDDRYYLAASFRRDGSSRLSADNRWSTFWSVSGAWRISKESFLKDNKLFYDLKLRASFGTNGNLPPDMYEYMARYATSGGYGQSGAFYWSASGNNDLSWEKSKNFNIGIDWNIYNRVNLTIEYYNKLTDDLLFATPTSYVTGFGSKMSNIGQLKNTGLEFTISSMNVKTKDFTWTTDFNLTYQSIKVKSLPNGDDVQYGDGNMYLLRENESMHTFYLPQFKGVNPETGLGEFWIDPEDQSKGVTNSYSKAGKTIVGKAVPDVIGGMTNTFRYKDLDLSFMISYQFGADMFDYPGYFLTYSDGVRIGSFNVHSAVEGNYWKKPGDVVEFPKPIYGNPYRSDKFSSREIKSTDNIRVRDITLGYNIPAFKKYINNLRVYFRTTNPFMIYCATDNVDPDVDVNGYRQTDTPPTRQFLFGLNFAF